MLPRCLLVHPLGFSESGLAPFSVAEGAIPNPKFGVCIMDIYNETKSPKTDGRNISTPYSKAPAIQEDHRKACQRCIDDDTATSTDPNKTRSHDEAVTVEAFSIIYQEENEAKIAALRKEQRCEVRFIKLRQGADKLYLGLLRYPFGFPCPLKGGDCASIRLVTSTSREDWEKSIMGRPFPHYTAMDITLLVKRAYSAEAGLDPQEVYYAFDASITAASHDHKDIPSSLLDWPFSSRDNDTSPFGYTDEGEVERSQNCQPSQPEGCRA